jgi:flagellar biogenesis protein FliO
MVITMRTLVSLFTVLCMFLFASPAFAYIGPGAGITAIGTLFALIGAVLLAIVGFIWYPIKRLFQKNKNNDKKDES